MAEAVMSERLRARDQKAAADLLEPDETVVCTVANATAPRGWRLLTGGKAFRPSQSSMALITERNVYVVKLRWTKATEVLFKAPLGGVEASIDRSAWGGASLLVGGQKLWLYGGKKTQRRARAIISAASGAPDGSDEA